jgi:CoA:oxalate CoA-transferase
VKSDLQQRVDCFEAVWSYISHAQGGSVLSLVDPLDRYLQLTDAGDKLGETMLELERGTPRPLVSPRSSGVDDPRMRDMISRMDPAFGVLDGIRVLDLTNALAGASATKILADLGAEVVKVETPAGGDFTRSLVPWVFEAFNTNKRSVAIDLKQPDGVKLVRDLVSTSDVFIHSMRPGAVEDLGLGQAELEVLNPRLIYGSFSAFGSTGPSSHRRGVDAVVQAESGLAAVQGRVLDNLSFVDASAGLSLALAIVAALMKRESTGVVDHVAVNLLDTALYLQSVSLTEFSVTRSTFEQAVFDRRFPLVGIFQASDGPFYMAAYFERDWRLVCELLGRLDLPDEPRFATPETRAENVPELRSLVATEFAREPRLHWVRALERHGILAGEASSYADVLTNGQVAENRSLEAVTLSDGAAAQIPRVPYRFQGQELTSSRGAPILGDSTKDVLTALGLDPTAQKDLEARGVVAFA